LDHRTNFREDRPERCDHTAIFAIFEMATTFILDFQKFDILKVDPL